MIITTREPAKTNLLFYESFAVVNSSAEESFRPLILGAEESNLLIFEWWKFPPLRHEKRTAGTIWETESFYDLETSEIIKNISEKFRCMPHQKKTLLNWLTWSLKQTWLFFVSLPTRKHNRRQRSLFSFIIILFIIVIHHIDKNIFS